MDSMDGMTMNSGDAETTMTNNEGDTQDDSTMTSHNHRIMENYFKGKRINQGMIGHNHGTGSLNVDQDYDIADLHSYLNYTFKVSCESIKLTIQNLFLNINEIHIYSELGGINYTTLKYL